ncbi:glycosyltransferase [Leptospira saintgironsiae]|uniref:Glycosyl transferase family 1 n=1 Tax=Leptospira saintgironsiae TaxID=2023183 RepID=A0A2M9YAE1_9LEPT|nr:glycosyltransferase [Leptospira saintgironsiae]PJZ48419.1 glycosyl transferase family 1 [Leptospira saintgironsiae]
MKSSSIALLGPVLPYRGGIAQYTTFLKRSLEKECVLKTISFSRQYPGFLYPGKSDKDPFSDIVSEEGVEYTLDCYNPFSWKNAADSIIQEGIKTVILNWWTIFWAPAFAYISYRLRKRGITTLFLCHNLTDHDAKFWKRKLSWFLLSQSNGYIVHSTEHEKLLLSKFPNKPVLKILHPIYQQFPPAKKTLGKRGKLELLFFGFIRPYKGLDLLLSSLAKLNDPDIYLTVVGEPWENPDKIIQEAEKLNLKNVEFHLTYTSDQEAAEYFDRADIIVLPYRTASGSGVATIAYNYERPILATRVGGFIDVVKENETGFLIQPNSLSDLSQKISELDRNKLSSMRAGIRKFKEKLTWDYLAQSLIKFIKEKNE